MLCYIFYTVPMMFHTIPYLNEWGWPVSDDASGISEFFFPVFTGLNTDTG